MDQIEQQGRLRLLMGRPWALALAYSLLALTFAALGWSGLWNIFSLTGPGYSAWLTLVTALPASAVVLLKRRASRVGLGLAAAIFVGDLLTFGGLVPLLVLLEMMHTRLLELDAVGRRRALGWVGSATVTLAVLAQLLSGDLKVTAMLTLQFGALLGLSYWYANSVAQSRELVTLYRQRSESAERLAALDREAAVQGERDRMARELHDVVAGHIAAVAIRSEAALASADPGLAAISDLPESAERRALRAVRDSSLEAHGALRSMIQVLRSEGKRFEVPPGRKRLPELVNAARDSGVSVRLVDELQRELDATVDQTVGRIVQEALANCVRHASGADVEVRLREKRGEVLIEIISSGGSALASPNLVGSGMGLELLTERARALGGNFVAGPEEAGVWAVRASLPIGGTR